MMVLRAGSSATSAIETIQTSFANAAEFFKSLLEAPFTDRMLRIGKKASTPTTREPQEVLFRTGREGKLVSLSFRLPCDRCQWCRYSRSNRKLFER